MLGTVLFQLTISTEHEKPIAPGARRSLVQHDLVKAIIKNEIDAKIFCTIQKSPGITVGIGRKRGGSTRICVNCRRLNGVT